MLCSFYERQTILFKIIICMSRFSRVHGSTKIEIRSIDPHQFYYNQKWNSDKENSFIVVSIHVVNESNHRKTAFHVMLSISPSLFPSFHLFQNPTCDISEGSVRQQTHTHCHWTQAVGSHSSGRYNLNEQTLCRWSRQVTARFCRFLRDVAHSLKLLTVDLCGKCVRRE